MLLERTQDQYRLPDLEVLKYKTRLQMSSINYEVVYYQNFVLQRLTEHNTYNKGLPKHDLLLSSTADNSTRKLRSSFNHLRATRFDFFFRRNGIDIPKCFKRSKSLRRQQHGLLFLRLVNFFMRRGLRIRTITLFTRLLRSLNTDIEIKALSSYTNIHSWQQLFLLLTKVIPESTQNYAYMMRPFTTHPMKVKKYAWRLTDQTYLTDTSRIPKSPLCPQTALFERIRKIEPLYNFYVYRVAKKIYKNTRGKSGRYTFIWKYIAPYKRTFITYYWLFKELKLKTDKQITRRILRMFTLLLFKPNVLWASRVARFSVLYVYRDCRVTLAETYRSVTK